MLNPWHTCPTTLVVRQTFKLSALMASLYTTANLFMTCHSKISSGITNTLLKKPQGRTYDECYRIPLFHISLSFSIALLSLTRNGIPDTQLSSTNSSQLTEVGRRRMYHPPKHSQGVELVEIKSSLSLQTMIFYQGMCVFGDGCGGKWDYYVDSQFCTLFLPVGVCWIRCATIALKMAYWKFWLCRFSYCGHALNSPVLRLVMLVMSVNGCRWCLHFSYWLYFLSSLLFFS